MGKLSALKVRSLTEPGRYGDGDGLWLQVRSAKRRSWLFRYMLDGKARAMGLGPVDLVSLADARAAARECRQLLLADKDPLEHRRLARAELRPTTGRSFREVSELFLGAHIKGWKNPKHRIQWRSTLETYAWPIFGDKPVAAIDTDDVTTALEPIWHRKTVTATRLRGRIEAILDYANARKWRSGDNPARWRGHLATILAPPRKISPVEHHPALPWREIGAFMADLRAREGHGARALEFLILTAARSGEVRGMRWGEVDLASKAWACPADRMKAGREHRVPLSEGALAALSAVTPPRDAIDPQAFVFPGRNDNKPLSDMTLMAVLRRMGRDDLHVHGFRSSFRDWAAEATAYQAEIAEAALAHLVKDKTEAAYRRGDLLEHRRRMMDDWAAVCAAPMPRPEVVRLRQAGA
jgi:integrase